MNKKYLNQKTNQKLSRIYFDEDINYCELKPFKLSQYCSNDPNGLTYAHRHKRGWYLGQEELLATLRQTVKGCIHCHQVMEKDAKLTKEIFEQLRPGCEYCGEVPGSNDDCLGCREYKRQAEERLAGGFE